MSEIAEYQVVRPDGTALLGALAVTGESGGWNLAAAMMIQGACAARRRIAPDGPRTLVAYFPDGYPGRDGDWPEGVREKLSA